MKLSMKISTPSPSVHHNSGIYSIKPETPNTGVATSQSLAVLNAFKELRQKAKQLEAELKEILREADTLRSSLSLSRRDSNKMRRGVREMQLSDALVSARREMELKKNEVVDLERDLIIMEDANRSIQRGIMSARVRLASIDDDTHQLYSNINEQEFQCKTMDDDLKVAKAHYDYLLTRVDVLPHAKSSQMNRMKNAMTTLQGDLFKIQSATDKSKIRMSGLHRYIEMLIGINSELCNTILAREDAKVRVMRIAGQISPPSSNGTSGLQPFDEMLSIISNKHASAAFDSEAKKAVKDARAVLQMHRELYADISGQGASRASTSNRPESRTNTTIKQKNRKRVCDEGKKKTVKMYEDIFASDINAIANSAELFANQARALANLNQSESGMIMNTKSPSANNSSSPQSLSSHADPWKPMEVALSGGTKSSPVFVPTGKAGNDRFNAFASVSKAVRAAKAWNQQVSSHIKSMENNGAYLISNGTFHDRRNLYSKSSSPS